MNGHPADTALMVVPEQTIALPDLGEYGFSFEDSGLCMTGKPTVDGFQCAGFVLGVYSTQVKDRARAAQFAIGDWLNFGVSLFGEESAQFVDEVFNGRLNWDVDTLHGYQAVSLRIPQSLRRIELDYSFFKEIAYSIHAPELRPAWVDWAAEEQRKRTAAGERRLSVRELRDRIQKAGAKSAQPTPADADREDDGDNNDEDDDDDGWLPVTCPRCHHEFKVEVTQ